MGQACCAGEKDQRMMDYGLGKNRDFNPSSSTLGGIKFPSAKKPKKDRIVEDLNTEVGQFSLKNPLTSTSGISSEPRQLNTSGLIYSGEWENGIPHGKGQLFYPDGSYYIGYLNRGVADGEGRFVSPQSWVYEGELQSQQAQGKGILYHKNLNYKYDGMWSGDTPNGFGRQEWLKSGCIYEGDFLNGKKHGQGNYQHPDFTYNGSFNNDQFDSYGVIDYSNGDRYEGNFEKGHKHGKGTYIWKDGSVYEGSYNYDFKHGQGKYKQRGDSKIWQGNWVQGNREGAGRLTADNKRFDGSWSGGKAIKVVGNGNGSDISFQQNKMR